MNVKYQVVIIGGGPVGAALALELGLRGVSCALVERRTALSMIPRGQNLTPRTMEQFYRWGIADELRAHRTMPDGYPIRSITAYGDLMSDYWLETPNREIISQYYYQKPERLPQYQTETVLRQRLAQVENVTVLFGWSAKTIHQSAEGVKIAIVDGSGEETTLEAEYVVGCDGSRSIVRDHLGVKHSGSDFDQLMVLAVFRSKSLHEGLKRFPEASTYNALDPGLAGYWKFFGRIDVGEGWFFHAPVPRGATRDNYDFHALIQRSAGFPCELEFDNVGFWDLRVQVAEEYHRGRVFIAGDAAHSHPPYGGFGLNSGVEDAVNLGWKLAAKLEGWGGPTLLESYGEERHPVFRDTGEDFIAGGIRRDREFLERYSPGGDEREFESAWRQRAATAREDMKSYEPHYDGSPMIAGPLDGRSGAHGMHVFEAHAGHHLAPCVLSSGRDIFPELGWGFALLAFGAEPGEVESFRLAASRNGVPLKIVEDRPDEGRAVYGARLILVRPDQFIAWTSNDPPIRPDDLLRRVAGW